MNHQLVDYIKQQLRLGMPSESVKIALMEEGWSENDVIKAFEIAGKPLGNAGTAARTTVPIAAAGKSADESVPDAAVKKLGDEYSDDDGGEEEESAEDSFWGSKFAFASLGLGALGLASAWFIPWLGLLFSAAAGFSGFLGFRGGRRLFSAIGLGLAAMALMVSGIAIVLSTQGKVAGAPLVPPANSKELLSDTPYIDKTQGFQFQPPKSWGYQQQNSITPYIIFYSPEPEKNEKGEAYFTENVNSTYESTRGLGFGDYYKKSRDALFAKMKNYVIKEEKNVTVNYFPAKLIESTFVFKELPLHSLQMLVVRSGQAYVITGVALDSKWEKDKDTIKASVMSFKFLY